MLLMFVPTITLNIIIMKDSKLIAEFMGIESINAKMRGHLYECPVTSEYVTELEYHTSWDWLMPVVEECLATDERTEFQHHFINDSLLTCDIEVVYDRVVEFIKDCEKKSLIDSLDS